MTVTEIVSHLGSIGLAENVADMARFGIVTKKAFGISTPVLKQIAKQVKKEAKNCHALAIELWATGIYDARVIAFLIDDPTQVTTVQMDEWAADFDNWTTVDGTCCYLFCRSPFAYQKAAEWAECDPEFIKRAGFALMAYLAIHDKKAGDDKLAAFLPLIENHCDDDRNFVKKAVNWALRQIGKRNSDLNRLAVETAERIKDQGSRSARWIAIDALREITNPKILDRIRQRDHKIK